MPSSVMTAGGAARRHQISSERAAVGRLRAGGRCAAGRAARRRAAAAASGAPRPSSVLRQRRQRAVGRPRLLVRGPRRPVGDGPEQHRLGVVEPSPPRRRRPARARAPSTAGRPSSRDRGEQLAGRARAARCTSSWAYTSPRTPSATSSSIDRVHGVGHDDAVDAAAAQRRGHRPPLGQRRVLVAAAAGLVGEVGDQAVPPVELPHVHDLGPRARSSRPWPTRRSTAGCAPRGRPGTSWPSCGACSGRGCAR